MSAPFQNWYAGRRVLVTGHTGFKGAWLSLWLKELGATVFGAGLLPPTQPSLYELLAEEVFERDTLCDVRDAAAVRKVLDAVRPDAIFHLAAQPLVRRSYAEPLETFHVNALGTAHVLDAVRTLGLPSTVLVVTSDKCYENPGTGRAHTEGDPLGGHDVYSASKACTELVAQAWRRSFHQTDPRLGAVATARAGNVLGGGDYAADRIVPDLVRARIEGRPLQVRNPHAVRPWQHVLECCSGYLWLVSRLAQEGKDSELAGAFNFGPGESSRKTVGELVAAFLGHWPGESAAASDPHAPHEAQQLWLSTDKARRLLDWKPTWDFPESVARTAQWYRQRHESGHEAMLEFSTAQIAEHVLAARSAHAVWAG